MASTAQYDYDLVVIGGGSGGLACSQEASKHPGVRVAVVDFVKPSPHGTSWGLGGTCVNVGCIPKKLMHNAGIIGDILKHDLAEYGWATENAPRTHNWSAMVSNIQDYIKALNFGYKMSLQERNVNYLNCLASFVDPHTIKCVNKQGGVTTVTSERFVIAVGSRPRHLECLGAEFAISSDDLFSLETPPGKTCCIGGGYVSLECAGFLTALGYDTTVYVRSTVLRGFDRECCEKVVDHMEKSGTHIVRGVVPEEIKKLDNGRLEVTLSDGTTDTFDTVVAAVGRTADTKALVLKAAGVALLPGNHGKIVCENEATNVPNIYAIGDVLAGRPELTPVAIQAGVRLAKRLYGGSTALMDYENIATTLYTPIEYGFVGVTEEVAREKLGDGVEVYHRTFIPLEYSIQLSREDTQECFCKIIVDKKNDSVLGIHYMGPNAGDIIQGWAVSIKHNLKYEDIVNTIAIHPTCGEELIHLSLIHI